MKNYYKNIKKIAGLAGLSLLIAVGVVSCDTSGLTDALDEFGIVVELEPINTTGTVLIIDAVSGELIEGDVTITYGGEDGSSVIDSYSDPIITSEVSDGILGFGIENSMVPSENDPASIRLIVEANGYVTKARTLNLISTGKNDFVVSLVQENNKPEGVKTTTNTKGSADESGAVQEDFTVESQTTEEDSSGVSINVASGTVFRDDQGNALSGQLSSSVTFYDPAEPSAMEAIPVDLTDENGDPLLVMGAASIEVRDSNGRRASSASAETANSKAYSEHGVEYSFKISPYFLNNITEDPDVIEVDIIYYDQSFNSRRTEGKLGENNDGEKIATFTSDIVPSFAVVKTSISMYNPYTGTVTFNLQRNGNNGKLSLRARGWGIRIVKNIAAGSNQVSFKTPIWDPVKIQIRTATRILYSAEKEFVNQQQALDVQLEAPPTNLIDATIDVKLTCENNGVVSVTDLPNTSVLYRNDDAPAGTLWSVSGEVDFQTNEKKTELKGGTFAVEQVVQGDLYNFKVNFDGETFNEDITITGPETESEVNITDDGVCTVKNSST